MLARMGKRLQFGKLLLVAHFFCFPAITLAQVRIFTLNDPLPQENGDFGFSEKGEPKKTFGSAHRIVPSMIRAVILKLDLD